MQNFRTMGDAFLNIDQKDKRVRLSEDNLALIKRNKNQLLRRLVSIDEKWIHRYTLKSNRQFAKWLTRPVEVVQSVWKHNISRQGFSQGFFFLGFTWNYFYRPPRTSSCLITQSKQYYCVLLDIPNIMEIRPNC